MFLFAIFFAVALPTSTVKADASDTINQRITVISVDDFHGTSKDSVSNAIYSAHGIISISFSANTTSKECGSENTDPKLICFFSQFIFT